jgi:hypothetical protein
MFSIPAGVPTGILPARTAGDDDVEDDDAEDDDASQQRRWTRWLAWMVEVSETPSTPTLCSNIMLQRVDET